MFVHNVISFRRGLMSVDTAKQFREYLRNEAVKGYSGQAKIVIGARVIHVTKLLCDLSFWAEVERLVVFFTRPPTNADFIIL